MTEKQAISEWTGMKGNLMAGFLNSPFRTIIEVGLFGLPRDAFLFEGNHQGVETKRAGDHYRLPERHLARKNGSRGASRRGALKKPRRLNELQP